MRKIVITGGTYAGKTSLIELFKKEGFEVVPDMGLEVIKELNDKLGIEGQKVFRANNPIKYYSKIIKKQLEIEKKFSDKTVIYDRGVYDYIAMLKLIGTPIPNYLTKLVQKVSYDLIFICDTLSFFDERKNSGRSLTKKDSLKLKELITEIYHNFGFKIIIVKEMPLKNRYNFIKDQL